MKKVLFDTNIILDIALKRTPFFQDANDLFILIDQKKITAYITATTITDIYFIAKKERGHEEAISFLENLLELVDVVGVDKEVIFHALSLKIIDFEDAIQISASELNRIDTIITRNKSDFRNTSLEVLTPKDFLKSLQ
jgi:predicted nucleic acid-binding protein